MSHPITGHRAECCCPRCNTVTKSAAEYQAEADELRKRLEELEAQWGVMARACGNWREFSAKSPDAPFTGWQTKEFQAAARAILERDELRQEIERLREAANRMVATWEASECICEFMYHAIAKLKAALTPRGGR